MSARSLFDSQSGLRSGSRGSARRRMSDINMVPFIDVMLVLLIIFMVTAPLIAPSVVQLPSVGRASAAPEVVQTVSLRADETLQLRRSGVEAGQATASQNYAAAQLRQLVQALNPQQPVVIAADKAVRYEAVMRLMDALKSAGVQRVALAVESAPQ